VGNPVKIGFDLSDLRLVGEELWFDGVLVAVLATTASATELGRFTDLVEFGEEPDEDCRCPPRLHEITCSSYKAEDGAPPTPGLEPRVLTIARRLARGGLVRVKDLERELRK
jgi:hypothetical protein